MLWVTAVGIVLRRQVVNMLFVGLDEHAQSLTADTLSFLLLGLCRLLARDRLRARLLLRPRHAHAGHHGAVRHDHERSS